MITIAVAALASLLSAGGQTEPATPTSEELKEALTMTMGVYTECLKAAGTRLEPSGEPASSVADSAFTACTKERDDVELILRLHLIIVDGTPDHRAPRVARGAMTQVDDALRREVVLDITEQRAARASRQ